MNAVPIVFCTTSRLKIDLLEPFTVSFYVNPT